VALYLALVIACRRDTAAEAFARSGDARVLYVSREDPQARLRERIDDILTVWESPKLAPGALSFVVKPQGFDLMSPDTMAWLREKCRERRADVLVLDTWTALSPSADPMNAKDQAQLAEAVRHLQEDIDGSVVVVDHTRKNRPDGMVLSSADIFGPQQKWAAAEHIVMLADAAGQPGRLEVFIESKDIDSERFFLDVSPRGTGKEKFTFDADSEGIAIDKRTQGDRNRRKVLEAVKAAAGRAMTVQDVCDALAAQGIRLAPRTVSGHLTALSRTGEVLPEGRSGQAKRYILASAVSSSAREVAA